MWQRLLTLTAWRSRPLGRSLRHFDQRSQVRDLRLGRLEPGLGIVQFVLQPTDALGLLVQVLLVGLGLLLERVPLLGELVGGGARAGLGRVSLHF